MKRTPWYPASVKPVHVGVYEWKCSVLGHRKSRMATWTGSKTLWGSEGTDYPILNCPGCKWRGLAEKPK